MGRKVPLFLIVGLLCAWFLYTPLPENTEQPWVLMSIEAYVKTVSNLMAIFTIPSLIYPEEGNNGLCSAVGTVMQTVRKLTRTSVAAKVPKHKGICIMMLLAELLGISHLVTGINFVMSFVETPPTSDENVTVLDTTFNNIPVRVYVPKQKTKTLRRGIFYIHGGGWCLASAAFYDYDYLSRRTAHRLDAVVISTNYRLAPNHHFPAQFEDVYNSLRWFLSQAVLQEYGVDPKRIGVSGDSAGGNLAAAVVQQLQRDQDVKVKVKIQALIYPALQALDFDLPSYRENAHSPILRRWLMVRLWSEYFTKDRSLEKAMSINQHIPVHSAHLLQFANWSSLLPERFQKGHIYKKPTFGSSALANKYPGFLDVRASPLLADDTQLHGLPQTYVLTCQHDVLRDDGVMYVTRLRNAGVLVTHDHIEDGFHGLISNRLKVGTRMKNQYLNWLRENL